MRELSLNVMDITQNSISAKATRIGITIDESISAESLSIEIEDNGKGMTEEQVKSVTDPFYTTRTTRPVGLGIPFFKMEAEMTGGSFTITSQVGVGTKLRAVFSTSHIDMIPLGDMNSTILPLVTGNPNIDFIYRRSRESAGVTKEFTLDTCEIKEVLGEDVSINNPDVVLWIRDLLKENTDELINMP